MELVLVLWMVVASVGAAILYTAVGVAPGTDETAVLAPVTLAMILAGVPLPVVLAFFMSAIVAKKLTDSIPVAVAGIPGGVMAAPMVEHGVILKSHGLASTSIRKMASGSVIGLPHSGQSGGVSGRLSSDMVLITSTKGTAAMMPPNRSGSMFAAAPMSRPPAEPPCPTTRPSEP